MDIVSSKNIRVFVDYNLEQVGNRSVCGRDILSPEISPKLLYLLVVKV